MEMEMVAGESIGVGEDLTPPLSPIAYSLHDSFLSSHCASCFSSLLLTTNPNLNYCSPSCSSYHSPLHISSGAHLLSKNPYPSSFQTSDLRVALLLLLQIKPLKSYDRICGLMSNRHNLLTTSDNDNDLSTRIKNGARSMAMAVGTSDDGFLLEEAVLCAVLTNAVEVQDHRNGQSVGIAVYDTCFSWINHSCSPNACYRFLPPPETPTADQRCLIVPSSSKPSTNFDLLTGSAGGPRIVVRSIKMIQKGEEVTIAYTDLLQPKELRQSDLWSKYRFTCCCQRCVALPLTYVDQCLQGSNDYFKEYIEDAIDDYLSYNDAESCCKKLEDALLNHEIRLHPQNHLCLNAYTTLASAYSSASIIAVEDIDGNGLKMKRFSAAYSLLLSLLTHDLFLHESSLIASVSNYWISAGESLINLAKCLGESRCGCECDMLASKEQVFKCMSGIIRGGKVWKFLVAGNGYLKVVKDPMDLSWFKDLLVDSDSESDCLEGEQVYGLGVHCLLYGGVLSKISGHHLMSCYNMNLLHL